MIIASNGGQIILSISMANLKKSRLELQGFSQDFERGSPKMELLPICIIMGCPVSIFSIVNSEFLKF